MGKQTCLSRPFCPLESLFNAVPRNQALHKAVEMVQFLQSATPCATVCLKEYVTLSPDVTDKT